MTEEEARQAARRLLEDVIVDGELLVLDAAQVVPGDRETMVMVALYVKTEHLKEWSC